jgi:hypothetical protein
MRVFDWVSYGNVTTYMADTPERLRAIYNRIAAVMNDFTEIEQEGVKRVDGWLAAQKNPTEPKVLEKAVMKLIDEFGGTDVHETFEYGTGFNKLEDPLED